MVVSQGVLPSESSADVDAEARLEPDAVGADERDGGDGGVADLGGETRDVVEDGIGRSVEDLVLVEGLDPQSFVFDQESIHPTISSVGDM